ncbi:hypothetical protein F5H01DRAFT_23088 [Linnemannia elongata]|nr:hypothetical protein F5H01DRAFT_23088 [Linnemannia elongata]
MDLTPCLSAKRQRGLSSPSCACLSSAVAVLSSCSSLSYKKGSLLSPLFVLSLSSLTHTVTFFHSFLFFSLSLSLFFFFTPLLSLSLLFLHFFSLPIPLPHSPHYLPHHFRLFTTLI